MVRPQTLLSSSAPYTPDQFFRSPGMTTRVRDELEAQIDRVSPIGTIRGRCTCQIIPHYRDGHQSAYRVSNAWMYCPYHEVGYAPTRFVVMLVDAASPFSPERAKLVSISDRTSGEALERAFHAERHVDDGRRDPRACTVYRDIELTFEDERRTNPARYEAPALKIDPKSVVTADNWADFVPGVRRT